MKIIIKLTFTALVVVGITLSALGQTPIISSLSQNGRLVCGNLQPGSTANVEWASSLQGPWTNNWTGLDALTVDTNGMIQANVPMFYRVHGIGAPFLGTVTFTKWGTGDPNLPGLLETLEGVVGGDIGPGTFAGEVLKETVVGDRDEIVAFYHLTGAQHSFSAIVHLDFNLATGKATVNGVITDGWMKGRAVEGEMTQLDSFQGHAPAFTASLNIKNDVTPPSGPVTFTKWGTSDPNLPGLLETLEGVVGGETGNGTFAGEVLKEVIVGDRDEIVAFYHFTGSNHSFSAIVHLDFNLVAGQAVVIGVVVDGWMKGHAIAGEMTQLDSFQGHAPAFTATLEIN